MVEIIGVTPWKELEAAIRQVRLLHPRNGENVYPYADARITLEHVTYDSVRKTSLYLARDLLEVQKQIAEDIAKYGYDPLELDCGLLLSSKDADGKELLAGFIPPIVEETGIDGAYVLDGSHRANLGLWAGKTGFNAVYIRGIREDCPSYAYPNDWDEVTVYDEAPKDPALRKRYREGDLYALFRDFGPLNGSRPRYPEADL